jgi:hypothetical protein
MNANYGGGSASSAPHESLFVRQTSERYWQRNRIQEKVIEESSAWNESWGKIRVFTRWAISSLLDGAFVALWVIIQWGVGKTIQMFPVNSIDILSKGIN